MYIRDFYLPRLAEWRAFILGAREFRLSVTTAYTCHDLELAYDCGREFAHWITLRRFEA